MVHLMYFINIFRQGFNNNFSFSVSTLRQQVLKTKVIRCISALSFDLKKKRGYHIKTSRKKINLANLNQRIKKWNNSSNLNQSFPWFKSINNKKLLLKFLIPTPTATPAFISIYIECFPLWFSDFGVSFYYQRDASSEPVENCMMKDKIFIWESH